MQQEMLVGREGELPSVFKNSLIYVVKFDQSGGENVSCITSRRKF